MLNVSKPRLPKGLSYVLKTTAFEHALHDAGVDCQITLSFWTPTQLGSVLHALYWPPRPDIPYTRLYVRAGAVSSAVRAIAFDLLTRYGLPEFTAWASHALSLDRNSPLLSKAPEFDAVFTGGELRFVTSFHPLRSFVGAHEGSPR